MQALFVFTCFVVVVFIPLHSPPFSLVATTLVMKGLKLLP